MNRQCDPLNAQDKNVERTKLKLNASDAWDGMEWNGVDGSRARVDDRDGRDRRRKYDRDESKYARTDAVFV